MLSLAVTRVDLGNSTLLNMVTKIPSYVAGDRVWFYNTMGTLRQDARKNTDDEVLKVKPLLNLTGPFETLAVGPTSARLFSGQASDRRRTGAIIGSSRTFSSIRCAPWFVLSHAER